jgi:trigger factor
MSYTVQDVNGCTKKLVFNFETIDLTSEIGVALKEKQKTVNLKGFRKGKAPLEMIKKFYGPQVESDALNRFIQNQLYEAINKEQLRVVGYPSFENMNYDAGKSVKFDALVEIFPVVDVKDMKGYTFTQDKVEVTQDDIDKMKLNYLSSKAEMIEVTTAGTSLDKGLFAVINFEGENADGERPDSMKGSEFLLEIGSNQFIPGFEEGLVGMKKGDKKTLELIFPAEYHVDELKNAPVKFDVEVLEIKERKIPEMTEEFAKEFGYESIEDFNKKTQESLESSKKRASLEKLHQQILEKIVAENPFDVPQAMIEQQEEYLKQDLTRNLKAQGFNDQMVGEYFSRWAGDMTEKAMFQVRSGLILDKLATKYEITTNDEDLNKKIEETAKSSGLDIEQIKQYYLSDEKIKKNLAYAIREEKTFEKIKEIVTVIE